MKRLTALFACLALAVPATAVTLYDGKRVAAIIHQDQPTMALAASLLARDLEARSGLKPLVSTRLADCGEVCVVIAVHDSALARALAPTSARVSLKGQWERYARVVVRRKPKQRMLLVAGSDPRGAVWGVIDLSRELGVSAWEWWADVVPRKAERLVVSDHTRLSAPPSVQYRGIFLNDEDWGLQPWAAKTYDPELGDIGPRTYARIYELMWRLKANTIWPAMHDVTKPFYQIPGNAKTARDYAIVVGTSHAEPMMRNNVREWGTQRGPFNFFTNRDAMLGYWRERIEETRKDDTIYSVGVRGIHDSAMEGAASREQARDGLAAAIAAQRTLLASVLGRPAERVPQALTLYKEVLDLYQLGLPVPDDVTLVWPDDNYGYLRQLSNPAEQKRSGGAGIYYHLSYWGRPHDYLWLGTTHPALVREQLERAWRTKARKLWIVNVGDIKPAEYLTQYFLDIAFDQRVGAQAPRAHLRDWAARQFDPAHADAIAALMTGFYDLAWERRPEFMGFGQTEPTTPNGPNAYLRTGGEEAERRLAAYAALVARAEQLDAAMPPDRKDAFFQLVLYPVRAAALLNQRILHRAMGRDAAAAQAALVADTARYNALGDGKWRYMMDLAPRRLPVFGPENPVPAPPAAAGSGQVISLRAVDARSPGWETVPGLGSRGASLRSLFEPGKRAATLEYSFTMAGGGKVEIVAVPVLPLNGGDQLRIGVSIAGGAVRTLNYATVGRSEEWKNNVLSNSARRTITLLPSESGRHTVRITAIDPGFVLDRIDVKADGAPDYYGAPPPTK